MFYIQQEIEGITTIRLEKGEDILGSIQRFCQKNKEISSGIIQGIGAVSEIVIGYYTGTVYREIGLKENLELLSLIGNIASSTIVHLHGIFGRIDGTTIGGHILPGCTVSFTCEIQIISLKPEMSRTFDAETQLNLLSLPNKMDFE